MITEIRVIVGMVQKMMIKIMAQDNDHSHSWKKHKRQHRQKAHVKKWRRSKNSKFASKQREIPLSMFDHALSFQGVYSSIFYVNFHSKVQKKVLACPLANKQHTTAEKQHTHVCAICAFFPEKTFKMQFRNSFFRLLVLSSQKLWLKPD